MFIEKITGIVQNATTDLLLQQVEFRFSEKLTVHIVKFGRKLFVYHFGFNLSNPICQILDFKRGSHFTRLKQLNLRLHDN